MGAPKANPSSQGYRGACDQCSQRKVRCTLGNGACQNCVSWGKICTYSPKLPSGRPRKRTTASTGTKEIVNQASEKPLIQQQPTPTPTQMPLDMPKPMFQNQGPLSHYSNSLSSTEGQLITPSAEMTSLNFDDMDLDMDLFYPNGFLNESTVCGQDYLASMLFLDQENMDAARNEAIVSPQSRQADMDAIPMTANNRSHSRSKPPARFPLGHRPPSILIASREKTPGSYVPTFSSLLSTIMDLRSKYDGLRAYTQASLGHGQKLCPDIIKTIDQTISSLSQYFNETGPYLLSIYRKLSGLAADAQRQQYSNLHGTIQMIVAGFSIIVETSYILHELLRASSSHENKIATRLDNVLRFSTADFLVGQCESFLGLVADILSYGGSEAQDQESILQELSSTRGCAESLRKEFAIAIEELKTPVL